ncbi:MAG TPA: NrdJb, partial [Cycloclasticus sp.]|nr:NrdJb [Cycloclasticus sp.]
SLVAEIGDVVESHLKLIGMIKTEEISEHQQKIMDEKRAQFEADKKPKEAATEGSSAFPEGSQLCAKCNTKAVIKMDGCMTCLNCGDSKCG